MRKGFLLIAFVILGVTANSQDVIVTVTGDKLICNVSEILEKHISYTNYGQPNGRVWKIKRKSVYKIAYENGLSKIFVFGKEKEEIFESPDNTEDSLKNGIYQNFNEFLDRNPSITNIKMIYVSSKSNMRFIRDINKDGFNFFDSAQNIIPFENVWGYCDGENIYVKHDDLIYLVEKWGRFCLLSSTSINNSVHSTATTPHMTSSGYSFTGGSTSFNTYHVTSQAILDITNGETFELNAKSLKKKILIHDTVLLEEFKAESLKKTLIEKYLNDFNKKNK